MNNSPAPKYCFGIHIPEAPFAFGAHSYWHISTILKCKPLPPPPNKLHVSHNGSLDWNCLIVFSIKSFWFNFWYFGTGNYILNYVASRPKLALFVIQALVQVIAKITKLGWFDVQKDQLIFRDIIADVKKFLQVRKIDYWLHVKSNFALNIGRTTVSMTSEKDMRWKKVILQMIY